VNAPCENEGNREILKSLEKALGIRLGQTTPDSQFTLESVNCLGACYMSPAIKIDDQIFGNLSPDSIQGILTQFTEEAKRGDALCR
jgi:NADH:ubiquinone oxidoreductase subunit E